MDVAIRQAAARQYDELHRNRVSPYEDALIARSNRNQKHALELIFAFVDDPDNAGDKTPFTVQGPPGTGKTVVGVVRVCACMRVCV